MRNSHSYRYGYRYRYRPHQGQAEIRRRFQNMVDQPMPRQFTPRPAHDGPTEFFGVRQQRRAYARGVEKERRTRELINARAEAKHQLRLRIAARREKKKGYAAK